MRVVGLGGDEPVEGSADVVVAIDGPAGSGKSTVARAVAERTGLRHLDLCSNGLGRGSFGPSGARAVAEAACLAGVTYLDVSGDDVGDAGAVALAASPHLERLRSSTCPTSPSARRPRLPCTIASVRG